MSLALDLEPHRKRLWWICYRMTGVAADAEELVQDTFLRALEHPPADLARDIFPWLCRVAVHAGTDLLRQRAVRGYRGPFLPTPVALEALPDESLSPHARYTQQESLSYAFLVALETLSPVQRGVLLLRDVLDYSVEETAEALALSEANVKTSHHRARAALSAYEAERAPLDVQSQGRARAAMLQLMAYVAMGDLPAIERMLSPTAAAINDGGGEFFAAQRPVFGAARIARFMTRISMRLRALKAEAAMFNGLPGVELALAPNAPRRAPRNVTLVALDAKGRVHRIYTVVASRKLQGGGVLAPTA
jgi:RNA polymerase sigma-70 factor (ECF subfamily)